MACVLVSCVSQCTREQPSDRALPYTASISLRPMPPPRKGQIGDLGRELSLVEFQVAVPERFPIGAVSGDEWTHDHGTASRPVGGVTAPAPGGARYRAADRGCDT